MKTKSWSDAQKSENVFRCTDIFIMYFKWHSTLWQELRTGQVLFKFLCIMRSLTTSFHCKYSLLTVKMIAVRKFFCVLISNKIFNNLNFAADEAKALQESKTVQDESNDSHKVGPTSHLDLLANLKPFCLF